MAKSYSNFSNPNTPLFDASSILRCYSSAAIMQQANGMPPMTPLPTIPLESMSPQMGLPDSSIHMPMYMSPAISYCQPTMPVCPQSFQQSQPLPTVQKYEFADFQPDLCCIGRHLKRLRDRYKQQPFVNNS